MNVRKYQKVTKKIFPSTDLTSDDTTYNGTEVNCEHHSKFLLMYRITETGTLVDGDRVRLQIQFREEDGTWHDYQNGPFGSLYEEESTTPCNKCVSGNCIGERIRLIVITDYANADPTSNYFTVEADVTLMQ